MDISIEYCTQWNYEPRALSLRDELSNKFGINSELIESSGGVFEISINDNLIFSKKELKRFPNPGEIAQFIEDLQSVTWWKVNIQNLRYQDQNEHYLGVRY